MLDGIISRWSCLQVPIVDFVYQFRLRIHPKLQNSDIEEVYLNSYSGIACVHLEFGTIPESGIRNPESNPESQIPVQEVVPSSQVPGSQWEIYLEI